MHKTRLSIKDPTGYQSILLGVILWNTFAPTFLCSIKNFFPHFLHEKMSLTHKMEKNANLTNPHQQQMGNCIECFKKVSY